MRLIDADELIEDIHKKNYIDKALSEILETIINEQPSAFSMGTKPIDNFVDPFKSRTATENNLVEENAEQLTVNDIDKVVKQLEDERELSYADFDKYVEEVSPCLDAEYDDSFQRGLERAIKIIKVGKING
jgi:hypothetical protein|nr:MAG TPA: hypothetical protein [Bacteriophage sp.]